MPRIKHTQSRTIQVKQFEPRNFSFEIEDDVPMELVEECMDAMKSALDKRIDDAVKDFQQGKE